MVQPGWAVAFAAALVACGSGEAPLLPLDGFHAGADVSFLDELEQRGVRFYDEAGASRDALLLLRDHGVTTVRLRLWNAPAAGFSGLAPTLKMAARVRAAGLSLLLDLHYSDHWADPGKQVKPAAWAALHGEALEQAVEAFTRATIAALVAQGTPPQLVQLGNEITGGLLWEDGRLSVGDTAAQWRGLAGLLRAAGRGVRSGAGTGPVPRTMLHIDRGGDLAGTSWFFDRIREEGVPFDVIGLSYYPFWHGRLSALQHTVAEVGPRTGKEVMVVETAYPATLSNADGEPNFVTREEQLEPGYAGTPAGQHAFLSELLRLVREAGGKGVIWWEPLWVAAAGMSEPNPWDNMTLVDGDGKVREAMSAFGGK